MERVSEMETARERKERWGMEKGAACNGNGKSDVTRLDRGGGGRREWLKGIEGEKGKGRGGGGGGKVGEGG
jgi:hypothetical protein